jgi:hypothetical protein
MIVFVNRTNPAHRVVRILLCALFLTAVTSSSIFAQGRMLNGHIPQAVKTLSLQPAGRLPSTNRLHLAIGLPLRNQDALNALLQQIYDPASPQYRQYLTPEQFTEKFGPTKEDYVAVMDFAKANGLQVTATFPNRVLLDVEGTVTDIERTLHTTMRVYNHPTGTRTFHAPDTEPSLDLTVPILHIGGLDNYSIPHPNFRLKQPGAVPNVAPNAGSGPSGNYMGNDFRAAYVPGTALTGSGQIVGLLQFDGYTNTDVTYYETVAGLPNVTLTNVLIDGATGSPDGSGGEVEVCLDIEMVISMAPGISKVILYIAPNPSPWEDLMQQMANDNLAKQISCSWGGGPPDPTAESALVQMAAQGQTFFNATGDSDAFTAAIDFPSDSTNITQVGGTTLTTAGPTNNWVSETVWNWGGGTGSSGGISTYYSIPPWQLGVSMASNQGSTIMRNVPDVALTADNVYVRVDNTDNTGVGGTSCAAPLWAGFTALVNQQAVAGGHPTVGFLNPALYTIGKGPNYAACFHDITTGNNESPSSPTKFLAVTGYDLCTGWGTPTGTNLINALATPVIAPIIVAAGSTLTTEGCSPTNGVIDPNEAVTMDFGLKNSGGSNTVNLVATLQATGGVTSPSAPQTYGLLSTNGAAVAEPFTFTANGACGGSLLATLQLQDGTNNLGTVTFNFSLGVSSAIFTQNFDGVTAPALPAGWTTSAGGAESAWVTSTTQRDTLPNAAFSPDPSNIGSNALVSPVIPILSSSAKLTFRNNYSLEASSTPTVGYDGGVLEIKVGAGAFQDILAAGGSFAANGYTRTISSGFSNPFAGRQAWSGRSGGFITTAVNLPAAAAGQNVQLRWRCATDNSVSSTGWYIDTISIGDLSCCTGVVNHPPAINAASISPVSPTTTNDLVANVTSASDADGDAITFAYQWQQSVDSSNFSNIAFTKDTLPAAATVAGDYYLVMITPNDGKTNGAPFTTASVLVPVDADGNGLNDDWEVRYFGHIGVDPNADPDGDGCNNLCEFLSGTDPTNSASSFRITSVLTQNSDVLVSWTTGGGRTDVVQATAGEPDGSYATNFIDVSPLIIIPGTGDQSTNYLDTGGATNLPSRYYRVRLVP